MSRAVERHRLWLVPICTLIAGVILLCGWQQLHAQAPMPTDPAAGGAAPAAAAPAPVPQIAMSAVIPAGAVKTLNIKNWDGLVTSMLGFKYKTLDERIIRVQLPAVYRTQQMTRDGWDTLFQCYGMDVEDQLATRESKIPELAAEVVKKVMEQLQQQQISQPGNDGESASLGNPAAGAMDFARSSMPAVTNGMMLPPLMPGLF